MQRPYGHKQMCVIHTHIPASTLPMYRNADTHTQTHTLCSHHPPASTKRSAGMPHTPPICTHRHMQSLAIHVPQDIEQPLPDADTASTAFPLASVEFLSTLLCLPSNLPGRSYSREKIKLPRLPLHTSYTAAKSHMQVSCSTGLWTFKL